MAGGGSTSPPPTDSGEMQGVEFGNDISDGSLEMEGTHMAGSGFINCDLEVDSLPMDVLGNPPPHSIRAEHGGVSVPVCTTTTSLPLGKDQVSSNSMEVDMSGSSTIPVEINMDDSTVSALMDKPGTFKGVDGACDKGACSKISIGRDIQNSEMTKGNNEFLHGCDVQISDFAKGCNGSCHKNGYIQNSEVSLACDIDNMIDKGAPTPMVLPPAVLHQSIKHIVESEMPLHPAQSKMKGDGLLHTPTVASQTGVTGSTLHFPPLLSNSAVRSDYLAAGNMRASFSSDVSRLSRPDEGLPSSSTSRVPNAWTAKSLHPLPPCFLLSEISKDGISVLMDQNHCKENLVRLEGAIVGKILGKPIAFGLLSSELRKKWQHLGHFKISMASHDCFVCIFDNREARDSILMDGPWFVAGQLIALDQWSASFNPSSMKGFSSPTWIRLPLLPLQYWDSTNLGRIASLLGIPLWVDDYTLNWGRTEYARICIRMDFSKKLPNGIWIESDGKRFFQRIIYEGLSQICFNCGFAGHKDSSCPTSIHRDDLPPSVAHNVVSTNPTSAAPSRPPTVTTDRVSSKDPLPTAPVQDSPIPAK